MKDLLLNLAKELSDKDIANELLGFGIRTIEGLDLTKIPESKKKMMCIFLFKTI